MDFFIILWYVFLIRYFMLVTYILKEGHHMTINTTIPCDFHMHTEFSGDSQTPVTAMIEQAIQKGLSSICITDHLDFDYLTDEQQSFELDGDSYYKTLSQLSMKYAKDIRILIGVETGLEPDKVNMLDDFVQRYPYDFIIGSSHLVHRADPYYPEFFHNRSDDEAFTEYFESIIENLNVCNNFDVYGHIDYVVRYSPNKSKNYSYRKYSDILDEILKKLIDSGKGIEVNTGGYRSGLDFPNPHPDIIKRYKELGGEIITIGSDAHTPEYIANNFNQVALLLKDCGYKYYSVFEKRKPDFLKL